jgi:ribosome-interacting GTPase 1
VDFLEDAMPTNLPPDYYSIEKQFKAATDPAEKIELLEEMMSKIPKHKGTDHLRADLRRKLSRLKVAGGAKKGGTRQASAYNISKEGAGQVVIVGAPNTGKSSLVATQTNADPEVSPAPFSTWGPTPGMMTIKNIQVQLIDTPPLNPDHIEADMFNLVRKCDLLLVMVDLQADPVQQLESSLEILTQQRVVPEHLAERFADEERRHFLKPCLVLANKCDDESDDEVYEIFRELLEDDCPMMPVSVQMERNLDEMKQIIFDKLEIIRVYSQAPGEQAKLHLPFVLPIGSTVEEFAAKVHQDFAKNLKSARVWGESAAFEGQTVSREHELRDGDIVELSM